MSHKTLLSKNLDRPFSAVDKRNLSDLVKVVKSFNSKYKDADYFLTAKPGYKYIGEEITETPAVLAIVSEKLALKNLTSQQQLPDQFEGYDVEVVEASPKDKIVYQQQLNIENFPVLKNYLDPSTLESLVIESRTLGGLSLSSIPQKLGYSPPEDIELKEVTAAMTLECHVSPDAGWKTLKPFIEGAKKHLQVAIYDFSAPHVVNTISTFLSRKDTSLKLVYDGKSASGVGEKTKINDVPEKVSIEKWKGIASGRFTCMPAWKGIAGICRQAYHTKLMVRDQQDFWLSSGNLQTSNQPDVNFEEKPKEIENYNREWHVIVSNEALANIFHKFIDYDFSFSEKKPILKTKSLPPPDLYMEIERQVQIAPRRFKFFPPEKFVFTEENPLTIQPILTPDNYIYHALKLIKSAKKTLYFQNQYITRKGKDITKTYDELLSSLCDASHQLEDCRILIREPFSKADKIEMLNDLQALGFKMETIKFIDNTHTKGIIVDGERIILGSHNWSSFGVEFNRDASLCINNDKVAKYYQEVFVHDWGNGTSIKVQKSGRLSLKSITPEPIYTKEVVKIDWEEYLF